jgi:hypothetical protein
MSADINLYTYNHVQLVDPEFANAPVQ